LEVAVANPGLAREAADLFSIADKSSSRSLNELAALASRQVPACSGATAVLWREGEPLIMAATHPDISNLTEVELQSRRGPETSALATGEAAHCPDTLVEDRWPEYAQAALSRGVRCSVTLAHRSGPAAVTLSLFGARPRVLDPDRIPLAELLVAAGGALVDNVSQYDDARRTALQLRDAAQSRALVDQAKGILMNALGCSADEALRRMREISQRGNMKVTEVARKIIESGQPGMD
jgi:ANTAR domain-containing protein